MPKVPGGSPILIVGAVILVIGIILSLAPVSVSTGGGEGKINIKIYSVEYVMTAAYKVYGNDKLGKWVAKTLIRNTGDAPLYDIKVSYKIEQFTDWSEPNEYKAIPPGGAIVDLYYPKFSSDVVHLQTATPTTLYIKIKYKT
ncbi:MAG: hypothetical protein GSR86_02585, partial [Desulfurococcales archaeon]|nr:hypothetical protein [Desulfurococcales archaeon]